MRWTSTPKSVENNEPTWLALFETALAVVLYWGVAWWFDTHVHLLVSICMAPWLLLRSPESIEKGVRWFLAYWQPETKVTRKDSPGRFWGMVCLAGIFSAACAYLTHSFLTALSVMIGVMAAVATAGVVKVVLLAAAMAVVVIMLVGMVAGGVSGRGSGSWTDSGIENGNGCENGSGNESGCGEIHYAIFCDSLCHRRLPAKPLYILLSPHGLRVRDPSPRGIRDGDRGSSRVGWRGWGACMALIRSGREGCVCLEYG
uniref:Uncharacterized protein n=1 Tax=Candidatus Kentrum sp. SD TaxID=2126332 RepID=A0A450YT58_9GAMM|nr:MAG: hypothetical protein BECKSD772F_GA0070984_104312 [Candidatus Kentron sp. SD]VFK44747.1 MAG: hypothetical protein BECKSD772E_GA0070983_10438 [Candidatus Kentron sp. SD]VFK80384.1 MAG: hypothetical protein BECKSD772D_GA0070982_11091 [Candidatus Kentron sp. SD]